MMSAYGIVIVPIVALHLHQERGRGQWRRGGGAAGRLEALYSMCGE